MSEQDKPTPEHPGAPEEIRSKLAVALDVDDLVVAGRIVREIKPWFGVVKVGLELFTAVGPDAIVAMVDQGLEVFVDLKLYDIPTTVNKAARLVGASGARYLTIHAQGGLPMLKAGVDGFADGAAKAGLPEPVSLAVTILTSDASAPPHILPKRVQTALEAGARGIVCAAADVAQAKRLAPRLRAVVPGIRPAGASVHDQARASTPREAITAGADLLVVGRAVTEADDRAGAAAAIADALAG